MLPTRRLDSHNGAGHDGGWSNESHMNFTNAMISVAGQRWLFQGPQRLLVVTQPGCPGKVPHDVPWTAGLGPPSGRASCPSDWFSTGHSLGAMVEVLQSQSSELSGNYTNFSRFSVQDQLVAADYSTPVAHLVTAKDGPTHPVVSVPSM